MPSLPEETRDYDYNTVNQLLSVTNPNLTFVYDDDGNMTQGYYNEAYITTNFLRYEIYEGKPGDQSPGSMLKDPQGPTHQAQDVQEQ